MQRLIKNTLATTGLTLITLALVATCFQGECIFIRTVYECLLVNILIQVGMIFLQNVESKYFIVEVLLQNGYILTILILAGFLFHWYRSTPIWVLILMGIVIYFISSFINLFRLNEDIAYINKQLKERKQ